MAEDGRAFVEGLDSPPWTAFSHNERPCKVHSGGQVQAPREFCGAPVPTGSMQRFAPTRRMRIYRELCSSLWRHQAMWRTFSFSETNLAPHLDNPKDLLPHLTGPSATGHPKGSSCCQHSDTWLELSYSYTWTPQGIKCQPAGRASTGSAAECAGGAPDGGRSW